jgi:phospholipid/cholesterol/gamma-HCH transport system permease protein
MKLARRPSRRPIGVALAMPFLVFFANVLGILGGAVMAAFAMDITLAQFAERFQQTVPIHALWVGMVKAPLFAFLIGLVGCFQGMMVRGNAESVGLRTTTAVVQGVFMVIVADALLFHMVGHSRVGPHLDFTPTIATNSQLQLAEIGFK